MKILKKILIIFLVVMILFSECCFIVYGSTNVEDYIVKYENGEAVVGIDVSSWQGNIDWKKVSNAGVKFAIIRCGYRTKETGRLYEDSCFRKNIEGAINNGIYVGVYFFSTALNEQEALEEANMTLNLIKGYDIKYFVAYDFETFTNEGNRTDNLDLNQVNKNGKVFLERIRNSGYVSCIYGNSFDLQDRFFINEFQNDSIWVAHYNVAKPTYYKGRYDMWQLTSSGNVDGINGDVDIDIDYTYYFKYNDVDISSYMFDSEFYADCYPDLKKAFGYNEASLRQHFQEYGKKEGRMASPIFDPKFYLNKYPELNKIYKNNYTLAYEHFIKIGAKAGLQGSKYVNSKYYLDNNIDLKKSFYSSKTKALVHFYQFGIKEGRQGSSEFNMKNYKNTVSSYFQNNIGNNYIKYIALDVGGNPFEVQVDNNININSNVNNNDNNVNKSSNVNSNDNKNINDIPSNINTNNDNSNNNNNNNNNVIINKNISHVDIEKYMFDSRFYSDKYPDLKRAYGYNEKSLRVHYEVFGKKEGRQASRIFNPVYYLNSYVDLKNAYGNDYESAYYHFIIFGAKEGRNGSKEFNVRNYIMNYYDLNMAFGNCYTRAIEHYIIFGIREGRKGN